MRGSGMSLYVSDPAQSHSASSSALSRDGRIPQPTWAVVLIATAAVAGLTWALMQQRSPQVDLRQLIAVNLASAQLAMEDKRFLDPPEGSALSHYMTVLSLDPQNVAARSGLEKIASQYIERAQHAIASDHFAQAVVALDGVRRVQPRHSQVAVLEARFAERLEQRAAALRKEHAALPSRVAAPAASRSQAAAPNTQPSTQRVERSRSDATVAATSPPSRESQLLASTSALPVASAPVIAAVERTQAAPTATVDYVQLAATHAEPRDQFRETGVDAPPSARAARANGAVPDIALPTQSEAAAVPMAPRDPHLIRTVQPSYPQSARSRGIEGWVDMTVVIGPSGDVIDTLVHERRGSVSFERAAVTAVEQWKYEPRAAGDTSIRDRVPVRVEFRLND